jgi:hypothetical protein
MENPMDILFLVAFLVELVFGIGFIFVPSPMLDPFGVFLSATATTFARLFGSSLISISIILWFARRPDQTVLKRGVVYSLFVFYLFSTIILLLTEFAGLMNALGWLVISIHLLLLMWFGYFVIKDPTKE